MSSAAADLERWFSPERLAPYYTAASGDDDRTVDLYRHNADLSAALWRTLGHVEILLRQAMHTALSSWTQHPGGSPRPWYQALHGHFDERTRKDVEAARIRATKTNKLEAAGSVVAELSFGFWRFLLASKYERALWLPCLRNAFPQLQGLRKHVERPIADLHQLRNRIAHHEPIHHKPLHELRKKALAVAGWIDLGARDWIASEDCTLQLLSRQR